MRRAAATDITSRVFGEQLKNSLGQQFVVENKPGAFGILAIEEMARSKPDGYTLMIGNVSTNAITPVLFKKKFKIDFEKDVVSVARLDDLSVVPHRHDDELRREVVTELVAEAKKNPGKVRYTSAGVGSFPHFDMEIFARRAGVEMITSRTRPAPPACSTISWSATRRSRSSIRRPPPR